MVDLLLTRRVGSHFDALIGLYQWDPCVFKFQENDGLRALRIEGDEDAFFDDHRESAVPHASDPVHVRIHEDCVETKW